MVKRGIIILTVLLVSYFGYRQMRTMNFNSAFEVGQVLDSLNHVKVYYNGGIGNVVQRNTKDGYNLGLEYQCVEFVKRYYYEYYDHKMPDSYGHAISFFDKKVEDGLLNKQRNLVQFSNPSQSKPQAGDLLVMKGTTFNKYGHVAIISKVEDEQVEIIQQNPGPYGSSRRVFSLAQKEARWFIDNKRILGWLRK